MPKRKYIEVEKDGKIILSVREKLRINEITLPSGKKSERFYVTIPKPIAEKLKEQGIEFVELQWEKENPLFFQIIPLRLENLQPGQNTDNSQNQKV